MIGLDLVRPLEAAWRALLDSVARARGWVTSEDVAALAKQVAQLSHGYNEAGVARTADLCARLLFSFPRDVPKGAAAVRELVASGRVALSSQRPIRVLDIGAGLGATTWGLARALEAAGHKGRVEATWIEPDAAALDLAERICRAYVDSAPSSNLELNVTAAHSAGIERVKTQGRFDIVLIGQVISELDRGDEAEARIERHSHLLSKLIADHLEDDGSLVVIEPALRDRTRHLHSVRDRVLEHSPSISVFAPCLHRKACPALLQPGDWCHEDVPVNLPEWLVPVARGAGLRFQGLTFSYLVLRKDGESLAPTGRSSARVVSDVFLTKGKREAFLCGELAVGVSGEPLPLRVKVMRLDRHEQDANRAWDHVARGDVVAFDPPLDVRPSGVARIESATRVTVDANAGAQAFDGDSELQ